MRRPHSCIAAWTACLAAWPSVALATRQCLPEFGEKSTGFWVLGWTIVALFVIAGVLLCLYAFRVSGRWRAGWRRSVRIASIPAMLTLWLLGFGIFIDQFALVC